MLRTVLFYTWFWLSLVLSLPFAIVYGAFALVGLRRLLDGPIGGFARLWARSVLWATGAKITVIGAENVPRTGGVCLVGNHQGSLEIPIVLSSLPRIPGFVAKREAAFMPLLNIWIFALGGIFIHRGNARKAGIAIERGIQRLRSGGVIIIYPEGTRSRGDRMGEFKRGSFKLATQAGVPIVPVTVDGSWHVWEEHKRIRPASVRVTMHPAIETAGMDVETRKSLPERVQAIVASALPAN